MEASVGTTQLGNGMNMRIIAMIPARLGSKRVVKKNLRLINERPLISYVLDVVKQCPLLDEIYLNSEADIFGEIAEEYGINFYQRPTQFSTDNSTNDEFALDFMEKIPGDILIQILPTSPLITSQEILTFLEEMVKKDYETLISVEHKQIACVYEGQPLNFDKVKVNPPSQEMNPVMAYATVLMGWKYESFKKNMAHYGSAYHGGHGKTGYFELRGLSTIDIDREEDFQLVEKIILSEANHIRKEKRYYDE
jgi:CMP-N-acetylneuraminic acid synthetase